MKLPGLPDAPPATFPPESEPVKEGMIISEGPKGRLAMDEIACIARLTTLGKSIVEIASIIDRDPATVRANLRHARDLLKVLAPEAVELWLQAARVSAAFGKHAAARDLVYAAGAAVAAPVQQAPSMQVNIGIALPGLPQPLQARTDDGPDSD